MGENLYTIGNEEDRQILLNNDKCDKYDYLVAVACGAIGGVIDAFFVGAPGESKLGDWSDKQVDGVVKKFAKMVGWEPSADKANNTASAIGFLERKYKVNYDQTSTGQVENQFDMYTKNHHMKSLSHSPDIIGLFFSILNQFTSTSSFVGNGKLVTINTNTQELQGNNFISKLFWGVANWIGHIMSDIAGSSGSRGNSGRGTGVVIPFYELFQFCKFGKFKVVKQYTVNGETKEKVFLNDFATIATKAFEEGYDLRFGVAMAIPVLVTELSIRLIWSIRRHYQYERPLKDCIPTQKHADLRVMLLLGNGTLCIIDAMDAGIRSKGNFLSFFMHLNLIAWMRFIIMVLKEVCIRFGIVGAMEKAIQAYKRIDHELLMYLKELEKIDIEQFKKETAMYNDLIKGLDRATSQEELKEELNNIYQKMGWKKPWEGDFDDFMTNSNKPMVFE